NGSPPIVGWTRMVITQVQGKNGECAVANHWAGNPWDAHCFTTKNGTATNLPPGWAGQTGIYGYYDCKYSPAPPSTTVGPISATRSEEHTSELQSRENLVCRLLLEK